MLPGKEKKRYKESYLLKNGILSLSLSISLSLSVEFQIHIIACVL
jgi:hypothetical protein